MKFRTGYQFNGKRFLLWLPVYLLLAFSLYVLLAGPLFWTIYASYYLNSHPLLAVLYSPLVWLCSEWAWLGRWVDWYVGLWVL